MSDSVEDERAAPRARGGRRGPPPNRSAADGAQRVYKPYVYSEAQRARKAAYKRERRRREKEQRCALTIHGGQNVSFRLTFSFLLSFFRCRALQNRGFRRSSCLAEHVYTDSSRCRRCVDDQVEPSLVSQGKNSLFTILLSLRSACSVLDMHVATTRQPFQLHSRGIAQPRLTWGDVTAGAEMTPTRARELVAAKRTEIMPFRPVASRTIVRILRYS